MRSIRTDKIELIAPHDIEFLTSIPFIPSFVELKEVKHFYQRSKDRLIRIDITAYPETFDQLKNWIEYRRQINKPLILYLTKFNDFYYVKLRPVDLQQYVYIEIESKHVYVQRDTIIKGEFASFLRYMLYYCGYTLRYKKVGKAQNVKYVKTKQTTLEVV